MRWMHLAPAGIRQQPCLFTIGSSADQEHASEAWIIDRGRAGELGPVSEHLVPDTAAELPGLVQRNVLVGIGGIPAAIRDDARISRIRRQRRTENGMAAESGLLAPTRSRPHPGRIGARRQIEPVE